MGEHFGFWAVVATLVVINAGYTGWALSLPAHEGEPFYFEVDVPDNVTSATNPDDVVARLASAGFAVERDNDTGIGALITATRGNNPQEVVRFWRLGGTAGASVSVSLRCMVSYMHDRCPGDDEAGLRARTQVVLAAAQLPVDANQGSWGDNDFETWREFGLMVGQIGLAVVSAIAFVVAVAVSLVWQGRRSRAPAGRWLWPPPPPQV
ncbi:MAG TPA: hypothetical protein VJ547_05320 [Candidatus Thermoplasmatota archaeon]|nr:hypothetical protein [Candidatus Thermoplasmatota archaeon]